MVDAGDFYPNARGFCFRPPSDYMAGEHMPSRRQVSWSVSRQPKPTAFRLELPPRARHCDQRRGAKSARAATRLRVPSPLHPGHRALSPGAAPFKTAVDRHQGRLPQRRMKAIYLPYGYLNIQLLQRFFGYQCPCSRRVCCLVVDRLGQIFAFGLPILVALRWVEDYRRRERYREEREAQLRKQ